MKCRYCGHEMELWKIWHPKYGVVFDEYENLKSGKYNPPPIKRKKEAEDSLIKLIQLRLFPVST